MSENNFIPDPNSALLDRVVSILEGARGNIARTINTNMVKAYWLIGREIVQEFQGGEQRAKYGKQVLETLSSSLSKRYGKGFSITNLKYFRLFYQAYPNRLEIRHPMGDEFENTEIQTTNKLETRKGHPKSDDSDLLKTNFPSGGTFVQGFSPLLSWSHYRALMRVKNEKARDFYENEAIEGGWSKTQLERQIHTQYHERCLHSQQPEKIISEGRQLPKTAPLASDLLKNPYVLEFLGYPNFAELHESDVERSIITHLQRFLLELGNGFAFVARQKHIRIEEDDRYIDLVFYHCQLKFYLLIDLKLGKLTHGDVGQMDGYVRMFDGLFTAPDDNPTIGLILCSEKCDTVARYSVLNDRKQIFASKYMLCLPTEEQLKLEIERERRLLEFTHSDRGRSRPESGINRGN